MRAGSRRSVSGSAVIDKAPCSCQPDLGQTLQEQRLYWPPSPTSAGRNTRGHVPARLVVMWFAATVHFNSIDSRGRSRPGRRGRPAGGVTVAGLA